MLTLMGSVQSPHNGGNIKLEISKCSLRVLNQGRPVILKVITEHRVMWDPLGQDGMLYVFSNVLFNAICLFHKR